MSTPTPPGPDATPGPSDARLGGDSLLLSLGRIAGLVSTLLLFILLSRTLSPEAYGSFRQVWMINKGLIEIFALGLPLSILYYLARLRDSEKKRFIAQSLVLLCGGAVATALGIYLLADPIARAFGNPALAPLLRLFCVYPVLIAPSLAVESVLVAGGRVFQFAVFSVLTRTGVLAAGALTVALGGGLGHLFGLILAVGVLEVSAAFLLLRAAARSFEAADRPGELARRPTVREQFAVALPTGISNMVGIINQELDKLIIAGSLSVAQFARYANGAMEIPLLGTIVSSVSTVLMPEFTRRYYAGDRAGVLRLWHDSVCSVGLLQFPVLIFFGVYATEVIVLLFSDVYRESAVIFQIYILATLPKLTWYGTLLVAIGRKKAPFYGSLVALGLNLVLNVLLIRWIGFVGPAIATTIASYGVTVFYLSRIRSALDVGWRDVFPWSRLTRILVVTGVCALAFPVLERLTALPDWIHLALAGGVYVGLVLLAYRLLGLMSWRDIRSALASLAPDRSS